MGGVTIGNQNTFAETTSSLPLASEVGTNINELDFTFVVTGSKYSNTTSASESELV
ncbi:MULTISPECIES: hypothetical protein [Streptococcus]|nr:hypothetical protein [Streptococcus didelphis]